MPALRRAVSSRPQFVSDAEPFPFPAAPAPPSLLITLVAVERPSESAAPMAVAFTIDAADYGFAGLASGATCSLAELAVPADTDNTDATDGTGGDTAGAEGEAGAAGAAVDRYAASFPCSAVAFSKAMVGRDVLLLELTVAA